MSTIIIITRPPVPNDPEDQGETFGPADIEDTSVYNEAMDFLTKLHEQKSE